MNVQAAWKRGYTGKNVVVTILDDGIERNHPDLAPNYVSPDSELTHTVFNHTSYKRHTNCLPSSPNTSSQGIMTIILGRFRDASILLLLLCTTGGFAGGHAHGFESHASGNVA